MQKQVMVRAWEIARKGQANFGGNVTEYIAEAMKMAWEEVKNESKLTLNEIAHEISNRYYSEADAELDVRVWKNYGKVRIYVNKGFKNTVAMFEFDQDENYIGGHKEMDNIDMFAADEIDYVTNSIQKDLHTGVFAA